MSERLERPAFYAARAGGIRDWWTLLHPPYTLWHLSYVVIGWALVPGADPKVLVATVVAFFLAVGVAAHAFDELRGRPLSTGIPTPTLMIVGAAGLAGALAVGVVGVVHFGVASTGGIGLMVLMAVGATLVLGYTLELGGGWLHRDGVFAAAWGTFPLLVAYFAASRTLSIAAAAAGAAAYWLSRAQRTLSTPARRLRRRTADVTGVTVLKDGTSEPLDRTTILAPLERALRSLSWAVVALAVAMAAAHGFRSR